MNLRQRKLRLRGRRLLVVRERRSPEPEEDWAGDVRAQGWQEQDG